MFHKILVIILLVFGAAVTVTPAQQEQPCQVLDKVQHTTLLFINGDLVSESDAVPEDVVFIEQVTDFLVNEARWVLVGTGFDVSITENGPVLSEVRTFAHPPLAGREGSSSA